MNDYYKKSLSVFFISCILFTFLFLNSNCSCSATDDQNADQCSECSADNVQAAIDLAQDGDTVIIPAGNAVWSKPVIISDKEITIQGAGIDKTIITDNTDNTHNQEPFMIEATAGKPFRITGFTFKGMNKTTFSEPAIKISGRDWRIDNCKFVSTDEGRGIMAEGYGLIDHCIFVNTKQGVAVTGEGDLSWEIPLSLGSADAVYIEDCLFDYAASMDGALDAYGGARYVFRYNTLKNTCCGHHGADSGGYRSTHSFEIYNNTTAYIIDEGFAAYSSRGGTGVIFNNVVTDLNNTLAYFYRISLYRSCLSYEPWGRCDGNNPCDGNQDASGYPCLDQHGRTTDHDNNGIQDLAPMYEWNNTFKGGDGDIEIFNAHGCPEVFDHLLEGRDFINDTEMPGYTSYQYPHPLVNGVLPVYQN